MHSYFMDVGKYLRTGRAGRYYQLLISFERRLDALRNIINERNGIYITNGKCIIITDGNLWLT